MSTVYACIANRAIDCIALHHHTYPMSVQLYTPNCPEIPRNNVYVGTNIKDHVVNGAAVFIVDTPNPRKPGDHATVSAVPAGTIKNLQFLGVSSITKQNNPDHHAKRARYGASGAPQNSVSVAVAGSVTLMCTQNSGIVPGNWVAVSPNKKAVDVASSLECAEIVPYTRGDHDLRPIGVCLSMAGDKLSITVLLRRDAFYHSRVAP